jgi:hypothetical protein
MTPPAPSQERRQGRTLSDADIKLIVEEMNRFRYHDCRFDTIQLEDLKEAVKFYKNFNEIMSDSKRTILKTLLSISVVGLLTVIIIGAAAKMRDISHGGTP